MAAKSSRRCNCPLGRKFLTKWFVISCFALVYSWHAHGCQYQVHGSIGDDIQLNCTISGDSEGKPFCRNIDTRVQYKNCEQEKFCLHFDNASNSIILTIHSAAESDFMAYECGLAPSATARVEPTCCFNLIQVSINLSPASSTTSSINPTTQATTFEMQEETSSSVSTNSPSTTDSANHSTNCETNIELKNIKKYEDICKKKTVSYMRFHKVTNKCLKTLIAAKGNISATISVQHEDKVCYVTCNISNPDCEVTASRSWEGPWMSTNNATDQISLQTTGQSSSVSSNGQSDADNRIVFIVICILCGVMIALVVLIVGLCFHLCSEKKPDQIPDNSIYSHTLGDIKPTQIELIAHNSSTSNSNHEREGNGNGDEKDSSDQMLASETSGWEDNVAYESCTNVTEGDYADVNDNHSFKEEDGATLCETENRNRKAPSDSNSNLYECVIDKGEQKLTILS